MNNQRTIDPTRPYLPPMNEEERAALRIALGGEAIDIRPESKLPASIMVKTLAFAALMSRQLSDNASKGDWEKWHPQINHLIGEMLHHMEKLKEAVLSNDADKASEHAADIGNFAMKAWQDFGV